VCNTISSFSDLGVELFAIVQDFVQSIDNFTMHFMTILGEDSFHLSTCLASSKLLVLHLLKMTIVELGHLTFYRREVLLDDQLEFTLDNEITNVNHFLGLGIVLTNLDKLLGMLDLDLN
jgi:hypothetical protein